MAKRRERFYANRLLNDPEAHFQFCETCGLIVKIKFSILYRNLSF